MNADFTVEYVLDLTDESLDPDEISRSTGLVPTSIIRKGERRHGGAPAKVTKWSYGFSQPGYHLAGLVESLLDLLTPAWTVLRNYGERYPASVDVGITVRDQVPSLGLERQTMSRLADLKCSLDIDLYVGD